jgi:single-stranded-DNA-specific exonuclease
LEHLEKLIQNFSEYCEDIITDDHLIKSVKVDTKIYEHEWNTETLENIERLAPFGEGNKEPVFLLENVSINKIEKVGTRGKCHLKIHGTFGDKKIVSMFR